MNLRKVVASLLLTGVIMFATVMPGFASSYGYGSGMASDYAIRTQYQQGRYSSPRYNIGNGRTRMSIDSKWLSDAPTWFSANRGNDMAFAYLEARYQAGYIDQVAYDKCYGMLSELKTMSQKNAQYLYDHGYYKQSDYEYYMSHMRSNRILANHYNHLKESGEPFVTYYEVLPIESLVSLLSYGVLDSSSPLMDYTAPLTRSNALVSALHLLGKEAEINGTTTPSPYINMPEGTEAYIAYAVANGIIETVPNGTVWDDTAPSFVEVQQIIGNVVEKAYMTNDPDGKVYFSGRLPDRFGTQLNSYNGAITLNEGFPLLNADMVHMLSAAYLDTPLRDYPGTMVEYNLENGSLSKDVYRAIQLEEFYRGISYNHKTYEEASLTDLAKYMFAFNAEHRVCEFRHYSSPCYYYDKEVMTAYTGVASFNNKHYSDEEVFDAAMTFFTDLGLSESDANALVVNTWADLDEKVVFRGHDFVITGGYNTQYKNLFFHIGYK